MSSPTRSSANSLGIFTPAYRFTPELDRRLAGCYRFNRRYAPAPVDAARDQLDPERRLGLARHRRFFHRADALDLRRLLPPGYRKVGIVNSPTLMAGSTGSGKGPARCQTWRFLTVGGTWIAIRDGCSTRCGSRSSRSRSRSRSAGCSPSPGCRAAPGYAGRRSR